VEKEPDGTDAKILCLVNFLILVPWAFWHLGTYSDSKCQTWSSKKNCETPILPMGVHLLSLHPIQSKEAQNLAGTKAGVPQMDRN
jgi:hypothetical protein